MIANYHTHTWRCGHALGAERDYVRAALAAGLQTLGFSDHTPYDFFDSESPGHPIRMKPEQLPDYARCVRAQSEKYRGRLEILLGVEAEYYPKYFPRLLELLRQNVPEELLEALLRAHNEAPAAYLQTNTLLCDTASLLERLTV